VWKFAVHFSDGTRIHVRSVELADRFNWRQENMADQIGQQFLGQMSSEVFGGLTRPE